MPDEARLAIVIQDAGAGQGPRPSPAANRLPAPVQTTPTPPAGTPGGPTQAPTVRLAGTQPGSWTQPVPMVMTNWSAVLTQISTNLPGLRDAGTMIAKQVGGTAASSLLPGLGQLGLNLTTLGKQAGGLGGMMGGLGGMAGRLGGIVGAVNPAMAAATIAVGAVKLGMDEFKRVQDAQIAARRAELRISGASSIYQRRLAEMERPSDLHQIPVVGGILGWFGDRWRDFKNDPFGLGRVKERTKLEEEIQDTLRKRADRIAPFSGPLSAANMQERLIAMQGAVAEDRILGTDLARIQVARAKLEANENIRQARRDKEMAGQKARDLELQVQISELINHTKDAALIAKGQAALDAAKAGDITALVELTKKYQKEIEQDRERRRREAKQNPFGWWSEVMRGAIANAARGNVPAQQDQARIARVNQQVLGINPMF